MDDNFKWKQAQQQLKDLQDVIIELAAQSNLEQGLNVCLDSVLKVSGLDSGGIYLVDEKRGGLHLAVHKNLSEKFVRIVKDILPDDPRSVLIMKGDVQYLEHIDRDKNVFPDLQQEKILALAIIPVKFKSQVICCLNIASHSDSFIPQTIRQSLTSIGVHIGSAIRRLQSEAAIKKTEQMYFDLVETAQDLIWQCDKDGRYTYLNPAWEEVMGYTGDEMLGRKFADFLFPEQNAKDITEFSQLLGGGMIKGYESFHIAKNGEKKLLAFNAKSVCNEQGEIIGSRGTAFDITERVRTAKELEERIVFEELLSEISSMFFSRRNTPIREIIRTSLEHLVNFLDVDRGTVFELSADRKEFLLLSHYEREKLPRPEPVITGGMLPWFFIQLLEGKVVMLDDLHPAPDAAKKEFAYLQSIGMTIVISIPLQSQGKTIGFISFSSFSSKRVWPLDLIQRLRLVGEIFMNAVYQYRTTKDRDRIFTYSIDLLATAGFDGHFKELNPAWEKTLGWSLSELLAVPFNDFIHPDDRKSTEECMSGLKDGTAVIGFQNRYKCRNGEYKWFSWNSFPLLEEQLVFAVARDINRQKKSEEVLRESEERYFELFNNINSGVAVYTAVGDGKDFIFKDLNRAGERIENESAVNLIGKKVVEARPGIKESGLLDVFRNVWKTGQPQSHPVSLYKDSTLERWYENFVYKLPTGEIVAVFDDVTGRKRKDYALQQSEERMRAIIDNALFGAHLYDLSENDKLIFTGYNHAADEILGVSHLQFIGRAIEEAFPLLADTEIPAMYRKVVKDGINFEREQFSYDDNSAIAGVFSIHAFKTGPQQMAVFFRDVTEQRKAAEEIRESEERYRILLQNANDMVLVHESTQKGPGKFIEVNEKTCKLLGYTHEEMYKMNVSDIDVPEQAKKIPMILHELYTTGHSMFMTHHLKKNREILPVEVSARLFKFKGRDLILSVARDITDRLLAEHEIQKREALLAESQKVASLGHYTFNISSGKWESSEGLNIIFGIDGDFDRTFEGWISIIHPDQSTEMLEYLKNHVIRDLHLFDREYRIIRRNDKKVRWVHGFGKLEIDVKGRAVRMFGTIQDVTERKNAEELLAAEKERLSVTLRSIGDAVISTDTKSNIVLMNRAAEKLTGWKLSEAVGKKLLEVFRIVDEDTKAARKNPVDEVMQTGEIVELADHTMLIAKDGTEIIIVDSGAPIKDRNSQTIGVVLVFRDNTEKQRSEENMMKTQKLESLGLLAGGIAHDFNNLLGGIFGYIEIARECCSLGEFEDVNPLLEKAINVFGRAKNLTQQLLTFSKGGEPVKKTGDLGVLMKDAVGFALSGANTKSKLKIQKDLWTADFDENQIGQVIDNIIINSKQAMPEGGTIYITVINFMLEGKAHPVLDNGNYVKITFQDEGKGIAIENIGKVFDPFFTTKKSGSGLGLATSYSIIKKHNGHIEIASKKEKGTTVTLYLPASGKELENEQLHSKISKKNCGRILVMDDEDYIREIITSMLSRFKCSVETSKNGDETIELCKIAVKEKKPFNMIICDLTIPGGRGGKDIIHILHEISPKAKIIASSGYSEDPVMAAPKDFGFYDCIRKPYRLSDLCVLLKSAI